MVDIDTGKDKPVGYWYEAVYESLGAPLCEVRTGRGGIHLYYRTDQPVGNVSWEGGEIRCAAGYVVLRDEDGVLAALEGVQDVGPVDVTAWPISKQQMGSKRPRKRQRASIPSASMVSCDDL